MQLMEARPKFVVLGVTSFMLGAFLFALWAPWTIALNEAASVMKAQQAQLEAEHAFEGRPRIQPPAHPPEPVQPLDLFPKRPKKVAPVVEEKPEVAKKVEPAPTHIECGTGQRIPVEGQQGSQVTPCGGQWYASVHLSLRNSWVDQPASHSPRVVRTDLRYQWTGRADPLPQRAPCRTKVFVPAGRLYLPNKEEGYIDAPARWVSVPCRTN